MANPPIKMVDMIMDKEGGGAGAKTVIIIRVRKTPTRLIQHFRVINSTLL